MQYIVSRNFFELPSWDETLPDMMDGIIDSAEKLAEGNIGLAIAKLAAVVMRPILPLKNDDEAMVWKLLMRSALKAWRDFATSVIQQDIEDFKLPNMWNKRKLSQKMAEYLKTFDACTIDREFFDAPGDSKIADCLMEVLCESLQGVVEKSENIISEFRAAWPRLFSYAVEAEYAAHLEQISPLFNKLNTPMAIYNQQLNAKYNYREKLLRWESECVFGEKNILNKEIYVHLIAKSEAAEMLAYQYDNVLEHIDLDQYLIQWALGDESLSVSDGSHQTVLSKQIKKIIGGDQRLFVIHGEPGSGKSTVLKHFAMCLVKKHMVPIFISLKDVPFSQYPNNYIEALKSHINNNFPWVPNSIFNPMSQTNIIFILDGLDEITGDVWSNAKQIIEVLDELPWGQHVRVLISGRTQLITKIIANLQNAQIYEICPLDTYPKGLQRQLWGKLQAAFSFQVEFEEINKHPHLHELLDKPLLMFLIAWLQKNSEKSILSIKNTSDLYNTIIECLYYRRHSGQHLNPRKYQAYRTVLEMIGRTAQKSNSNVANINDVKAYAKVTNRQKLFDEWINSASLTTSKLLLTFFGFANKESMSISFYHRSFVEFLAIEDFSNQLMFLPQDPARCPESIEKLNKLFDQYNLFHGEDSHIEDFWLGKLEFISENEQKFKTLTCILGIALTYVDKSELSENPRQNILKAVAILFRFLEDRGLEMQFKPHSSLKNIHAFRSNMIPSLIMQQETTMERCDFSNSQIRGLTLCSTVALSDCYFNAAKIEFLHVLEAERTECQSLNRIVKLHKLQSYATKYPSVDLRDTQITECIFDGAEFTYNQWQGVDAKNVSFRYAFLKKSVFCWVELNRADFSYLNLTQTTETEPSANFKLITSKVLHSSFDSADLRGAEFMGVEIQDSTFRNAKLAHSKWITVEVEHGKREYAKTSRIQHRGDMTINQKYTRESKHITNLLRVDFTNADLSFAKFDSRIVFVDCIMKGAKLDGVSMVDFDLTKPNIIQMLSEADLHNVNWKGAEKFKSRFEGL